MRFRSLLLSFGLAAFGLVSSQGADEKNGLQVSVQKATLDRADVRGSDVNTENLDRLMGLRVTFKNVSFKPMPEGEVTWEILKRRWDNAQLELTTGTEKLPHLKVGETLETAIGIAKVTGYLNGAVRRLDELDWRLTIKQDGKEVAKFASKSNFDMLLKRAAKVDPPAAPATPATPAPAK
jgi:hypothetical protein